MRLKPLLVPAVQDELALARLFVAADLTLWDINELHSNFMTTLRTLTLDFPKDIPAVFSSIDLKSWALTVLRTEEVKKVINEYTNLSAEPASILKEVKFLDCKKLDWTSQLFYSGYNLHKLQRFVPFWGFIAIDTRGSKGRSRETCEVAYCHYCNLRIC